MTINTIILSVQLIDDDVELNYYKNRTIDNTITRPFDNYVDTH
jgi:hypothetical protein